MSSANKLTHFNASGDAQMVDVGEKKITYRVAVASGRIRMLDSTLNMILDHKHSKGDVLGIARIAGIMGAKRTSDLVPLCHPIAITKISIEFEAEPDGGSVLCEARVETRGKTGVEMEALTAVQVSLLTIYDMCKAVDRGMVMEDIGLQEKSGGKSGYWKR